MSSFTAEAYPQLSPALTHSRYLERLLTRRPEMADTLVSTIDLAFRKPEMQAMLPASPVSDEELKRALRQLRQHVMARLIVRELTGRCDLAEAMLTISELAEVAVAVGLKQISQPDERYGQAIGEESGTVQELIVVGMGKLGGHELNVSSDIDLIFIYPEDGETDGKSKIDNHDWFTRAGKRLIQLIADPTDEGFVFRVDMRLRPFGDSGPLVTSFAALENYLLTQGREWERYAWIKARALSGDEAGLMSLVTPFIYRKYLDFGAFQSMRELHSQIRREVMRHDRLDNIKLGPGGIREIEFVCQVFQLIRGGRHKALRTRSTMRMFEELQNWGMLSSEAVAELRSAYVFLRNLEHRIMYLDDAQTQMLPSSEIDRSRIAISMGFSDWAAFIQVLNQHRAIVSQHFDLVFEERQESSPSPITRWPEQNDEDALAQLSGRGYQDAQEILRRLSGLQSGARYQQMPERSRKRLDKLLPALVDSAASQSNPDATLIRLLGLMEAISRRESYLALLAEHPQSLQRLASLYSASSWVGEFLTRHPILLDELLDPRLLDQKPDWAAFEQKMRSELAEHAGDTEAGMDTLRVLQHTQVFRLAAQDIAGLWQVEALSDQLSALADLILKIVMEVAWQEMPKRHRDQPQFAAIGYGKLGGKELGYASDLDLVFLYDDDHPDAGDIYARYTRRIQSWIATLTSAGMLYEIDLRLRPNGASGLLVSSIAAFEQYQKESAWEWERQALTRARFCCGDQQVGAQFERIRADTLLQERDTETLRKDVIIMRQRMLETHPAKENDVKHRQGGLVDIEFIIQYLILAHAHDNPDFISNTGTIALLGLAADRGLIPRDLAEKSRTAYRELRRLQHISRLNDGQLDLERLAPLADELTAARALWVLLFGE